MIRGAGGSASQDSFEMVLVWVYTNAGRDVEEMEIAFVQYMKATPVTDGGEGILGYISARSSTSNEKNYTLTQDIPTGDGEEIRDA